MGRRGTVPPQYRGNHRPHRLLQPELAGHHESGVVRVSLWNTAAPGDPVVSASWLNPLTQSWQESTTATGGDWTLDISTSQPRLNVPPNTTASVRVRLTFAPSTRPGAYRLQVMPALSSQLFNPQGVNDLAVLNYNWPQYNIQYGTAAVPATPHATPSAPARQAPKPTNPSPFVTQSPSPFPATSAAVASTAPSASASGGPAVSTVEMAAHETRSRSAWPYLAALAAVALLAAGGYWLRRHANGWTSSEPEQVPSATESHPYKGP